MNIGIDISSLMYGRGVSRYTANLVHALIERRDSQLSLYGSSFRQKKLLEKKALSIVGESSRHRVCVQSFPPSVLQVLWDWFHLNPVSDIFPDLDVFHSWDWLQPPDKNLPLVSTIHDLAILRFPETAHPKIVARHQHSWKVLKERHAHIIAVSQATKKDIVELLGFPADHVHVVYEALPLEQQFCSERLEEDEYELIKQRLKLDAPYILFVGTREPRKNLRRLIEAWQPLSRDVQLIIAGESGWDETSHNSSLAQTPNLRFLGRVSDQELVVLYGEAEVFAFPCLYEGFGLPILEAFYHGTPVLTSAVSSMPEVAGNAAELIDPLSIESIHAGLVKLLNEPLIEQKKRLQRMIIRLHMFSWSHVADETKRVYRRAIEEREV